MQAANGAQFLNINPLFLSFACLAVVWAPAQFIVIFPLKSMYSSLEWPISLLPIFAKVFERLERLLFNALFDNDLFTTCQSGFMQGDSCIS